MSVKFLAPETNPLNPRIVVIGVGGAGSNAVNNMIRSGLAGVEFVVTNTDSQSLQQSEAERKIQLGTRTTEGLGSGARPEVGRESAEEAIEQIIDHLGGAHMAFITAGMGGGTGTGAAPVIARICREQGILTVGVVTKPFHFEGARRMMIAEQGIEDLQQHVETLIMIPNQNLFHVANERTTFAEAFSMADDVLHSGVKGITDLMVVPGLINLDFADVRTVMREMGKAMMGTGEAEGENRAIQAAEAAIKNPLLEDLSMHTSKGVLINITGGMDLTLYEVDDAANRIREEVDPDANIIVGSALDEALNGKIRVSMVATGIDVEEMRMGTSEPAKKVYDFNANRTESAAAAESEPEAADDVEEEAVAEPMRATGTYGMAETVQATSSVSLAGETEQSARTLDAADRVADMRAEATPSYQSTPSIDEMAHDGDFVAPEPQAAPAMPPAAVEEERAPFTMPPAMRPRSTSPLLRDRHESLPRSRRQSEEEAPVEQVTYASEGDVEDAKPRRRISLLSRMMGSGRSEPPAPAQQYAPATRVHNEHFAAQEPQHHSQAPAAGSTSNPNDPLDIPAFLRRQAN